MRSKIVQPKHVLIEKIAVELAAVFYEAGRSTGLSSKHKNARSYARANFEKFIPKAVEYCLEMLKPHSNVTEEARMEIYEALMERHNDPELCEVLPNIDVNKLITLIDAEEKKKVITINTKPPEKKTVLHNG